MYVWFLFKNLYVFNPGTHSAIKQHVLRRLNKIFLKQLLLKVYKLCFQSKLDYGLSFWGCTTEGNLDLVQRIQIFVLELYVRTMIISTLEEYISLSYWNFGHSLTQRLFSVCFDVQMYTWSCTSLLVQWCYYGRRHPWLQYKEFRKYGSIRTKMCKRTLLTKLLI